MNRHDKFRAYWESIGRPQLEYISAGSWAKTVGEITWFDVYIYRIADDPHWELRLQWVNSDFTLPIEFYCKYDKKWKICIPYWEKDIQYREAKEPVPVIDESANEQYPHYFKNVEHLKRIDIYRIIDLYEITDPAIQHAVKKLLVSGGRGAKDADQDIQESIDALERWKQMRLEDLSQ